MSSPAVSQQEGLLNRYAVAHELGSGRFGRSILATDTKTSNLCSLKYINAPLCDGTSAVLNSYLRIKHPNVLRHLAFVSNHRRSTTGVADSTVIVTEYAGFGSLKREVDRRREMFMESDSTKEVFGAAASEASSYGVLSSCCDGGGNGVNGSGACADNDGGPNGGTAGCSEVSSSESQSTPFEDSSPGIYFSLLDIIQIMIQLLLAIRHLHKQKEVHRDITLQNIFVTQPDRLIKLGHCHAFDYDVMLGLQPPELSPYLKEQSLSPRGTHYASKTLRHWKEPCDIWALGCVLYEIATLRPIKSNWEQFLGYYLRQHSSEEWALAFEKIIKSCLQPDPQLRATISMLMSMREVLLAYNLLVTNRDISSRPKLRHVLYYWEKSASKKLQLKGIKPTAVYIPQPITSKVGGGSIPILKSCPTHNSLSEEQILSPGRGGGGGGVSGAKIESSLPSTPERETSRADISRAGRSYKLPNLTNPANLNAIGSLFQQPAEYRLLSRSTIRRSLSQEARDKFSKIEGRCAIPPRPLHQGFPSARSARGAKLDKETTSTHHSSSGGLLADKKHRQTIASEAAAGRAAAAALAARSNTTTVPPKLSSAEPEILRPRGTLGRETSPTTNVIPARASMLAQSPSKGRLPTTRVRRVGSHYEVPIPREDRQGTWRDIQARGREYSLIEAAMKSCVAVLDASPSSSMKSADKRSTSPHPDTTSSAAGDSVKASSLRAGSSAAAVSTTTTTTTAALRNNNGEDPLDRIPLMVSMHKPSSRIPLPGTASWLFSRSSPSDNMRAATSSTQRAIDLIRIASAENNLPADCRRTIGRMNTVYQPHGGAGGAETTLPTTHMSTSAWHLTEGGAETNLLSFNTSGRYRSASHEHHY